MISPNSPSRTRFFFGGLWPRLPILHRYIARELLLVSALAATILSSLSALCGLLRPLRKHGVTATELVEILVLLFPFFLIFTVPFALMLACCWVYGRLSADNELNACSSSGINIQALLIGPLALGIFAMILNGVLANWVVPNWALDRFEVLLARHGKDLVYRELGRSGSFTLDRHQIGRRCVIHADRVVKDAIKDGDILEGIAVVVFGKDSRKVEQIITARRADVKFDLNGGLPDSIAIVPLQATVVELPEYHTYKAASLVFSGVIRETIGQEFSAMSLGDLMDLRDDPELYNPIGELVGQGRRVFIANELVKRLQNDLAERGHSELSSGGKRYRITGRAAEPLFDEEGVKNVLADATIGEYERDEKEPVRVFTNIEQVGVELIELPTGRNAPGQESAGSRLTASLALRNATITRPTVGPDIDTLEQARLRISDLVIPEDISKQGLGLSAKKLKQGKFSGRVPTKLLELGRQIVKREKTLSKEIALEIHSRLAMAVSCPVLAVLGALLGAIFRKGQFLVAVGLSLGPAMVAFLFIVMGQKMVDSEVFSTGLAVGVAWTGLALLGIAILVLAMKVLRK